MSIASPSRRSKSITRSPIFLRGHAYMLLEHARKVLGVFKSKAISNFTQRFIGIEYPFLGNINQF